MNPQYKQPLNGLLAGCAIVAGWWGYGWRGIVLAVTVIVFWMVLQFTRATRVLQNAAQRPVGTVDSVVMFQSRMSHGLNMQEVIALAGSLGRKFSDHEEWQWEDGGGNQIVITFRRGVVIRWAVARAEPAEEPIPTPNGPTADQANEQM